MSSKPDHGPNAEEHTVQEETTETTPEQPSENEVTDIQHLVLRYRKRAIYLLAFYVPLLIIPWILTCLIAGPPATNGNDASQFSPQTDKGLLSLLAWVGSVRVLNSLASVVTIPVTSALLAQAAVVYTQKRLIYQRLSIRQTFALADRRWSDITVLIEASRATGNGIGSRFLWWGMALVVLSAVQHPIQNVLVSWQSIPVKTCLDNPVHACGEPSSFLVGYDPEPGDLASVRQNRVVQEVMSSLTTFNNLDFETHLWPDPSYVNNKSTARVDATFRQTIRYWIGNPNFFVTALQNATSTGVLRQHAMRLNSSIHCDPVPQEHFPSTCAGRRPFTASLSKPLLDVRVCVPGEYGVSPWSLSRNRQDITEEFFLDVVDRTNSNAYLTSNFTIHCEASTSRGYFELGNYRNYQMYGPLLEKWPGPEELAKDFDDYLEQYSGAGKGQPTERDETELYHSYGLGFWTTEPADPFGTYYLNASGPLMTSAMALFGNRTFFHVAATSTNKTFPPATEQICQQGRIPFSTYTFSKFNDFQARCAFASTKEGGLYTTDDPDSDVVTLIGAWINSFVQADITDQALTASMYLSNRAFLTQAVPASFPFSARKIMFGRGTLVPIPAKTVAGTVIVSLLLLIQLAGLAFVMWYIYQFPTWTPSLDAVSVARIGASMKVADLPPLGEQVSVVDETKLNKVKGFIALNESGTALQLGGPRLITREHVVKRTKYKRVADGDSV